MFLSNREFKNIIKNTPLVSIDLCILKKNKILLGKRINSPAKDFFFVPGGRILKSEIINDAFKRILKNEMGFTIKKSKQKSIINIGIYEHFYKDNFYSQKGFGTHYLVLAYLIPFEILQKTNKKFKSQHSNFKWFAIKNKTFKNKEIHHYTINYLRNKYIKNFYKK